MASFQIVKNNIRNRLWFKNLDFVFLLNLKQTISFTEYFSCRWLVFDHF